MKDSKELFSWFVFFTLTPAIIFCAGLAIYKIVIAGDRPAPATLDITCYSCGGVTYENKVQVKEYKLLDCGGIRFQEEKTGNWVNLSGECVVKILEK